MLPKAVSIGNHLLRGVEEPVALFTLPELHPSPASD